MKKVIYALLIIMQTCNILLAQEFCTKFYFENFQGETDILEIGYDPKATHYPSSIFEEIEYDSPLINPDNKNQTFFIDPWWWNYTDSPFESSFYTKKRIINKNAVSVCERIIGIIVPTAFLPITISWDETQSNSINNKYCFFIDRHFSEFSCYANKLFGEWDYAQRVDIRQKGSIQFSTINDFYPNVSENENIFSVIYFGFFDPSVYLGINGIKKNSPIFIYPNPVVDFCQIEKGGIENIVQIQILSISGNKIMSLKGDVSTLDCRTMAKGTYIVEVVTVDNEKYYCKLIKR